MSSFVSMLKILIRAKGYRRLTFWVALLWGFKAFAYWGVTTYMTTFFNYIGINSNGITLGAFIVQLPGMAITYFLMESSKGGRILTLRVCGMTCSLGLVLLTILLACGVENSALLYIACLLTYVFTGPMWNALYTFSVELYPTSHRGSAMALFSTVNALCTLTTVFVGSLALDETKKWVYPLIWAACYLGTVAVTLMLKSDTKGIALKEYF